MKTRKSKFNKYNMKQSLPKPTRPTFKFTLGKI